MFGRRSRGWVCAVFFSAVAGCASGSYRVEVALPAGATAEQVTVQVLPSCAGGDVLASSTVTLGSLPNGDYGVRALVLDATCQVVAEGCVEIHAGGGGGTVHVDTTSETPRACRAAEACACMPRDGGMPDADQDAPDYCVDCDGMGRCEDLLTDRSNCGECGRSCMPGEHCTGGICG